MTKLASPKLVRPTKVATRVPTRAPVPLPEFATGREFDALSDEDKERVWESYNRPVPFSETRPLTTAERKQWERIKGRKPAGPKAGTGAKVISVSVEGTLLDRADAYATRMGLTRAQLVARGLELAIAKKSPKRAAG